jgi:hypothetical protein
MGTSREVSEGSLGLTRTPPRDAIAYGVEKRFGQGKDRPRSDDGGNAASEPSQQVS